MKNSKITKFWSIVTVFILFNIRHECSVDIWSQIAVISYLFADYLTVNLTYPVLMYAAKLENTFAQLDVFDDPLTRDQYTKF